MTLVITDDSTRAQLAEAIGHMRAKQKRMPEHWVDRRAEIGEEIDKLVAAWLVAPA